ncbi:hypothetical protein CTI14_69670, partial [Methylobacterium radiotolerans]
ASSLIPGNENAVFRVINGLLKLGANVIHKGMAKVHVSGHAAAGASSLIPGNENAVFRVINGLLKLGANVIHKGMA